MTAFTVFANLAFAIFAAELPAYHADESCGRRWADSINAGTTASVILQYGAPVALYTTLSPTLGGCAPATAYYSEGQAIAQINLSYAKGSFAGPPLVEKSLSNDTANVASYSVTYESQHPEMSSYSSIRPKTVDILQATDGSNHSPLHNVAKLLYDDKGRIAYIDWTYNTTTWDSAAHVKIGSPPFRLRGKPRGFGSATKGYEKFVYGDADHPLQATYYESLGKDGFTSMGYKWHTNQKGHVTDVETSSYEDAMCQGTCFAPKLCCRPLGSNESGTCFNGTATSCAKMDGNLVHYEYDSSGRMAWMNVSGIIQSYDYNAAGRLVKYTQPGGDAKNDTLFEALYVNGHIKFQVVFVIYPFFPEMWGFDPPRHREAGYELQAGQHHIYV